MSRRDLTRKNCFSIIGKALGGMATALALILALAAPSSAVTYNYNYHVVGASSPYTLDVSIPLPNLTSLTGSYEFVATMTDGGDGTIFINAIQPALFTVNASSFTLENELLPIGIYGVATTPPIPPLTAQTGDTFNFDQSTCGKGAPCTYDNIGFSFAFTGSGDNDLYDLVGSLTIDNYNPVPEPNTFLLLAAGMSFVLLSAVKFSRSSSR